MIYAQHIYRYIQETNKLTITNTLHIDVTFIFTESEKMLIYAIYKSIYK